MVYIYGIGICYMYMVYVYCIGILYRYLVLLFLLLLFCMVLVIINFHEIIPIPQIFVLLFLGVQLYLIKILHQQHQHGQHQGRVIQKIKGRKMLQWSKGGKKSKGIRLIVGHNRYHPNNKFGCIILLWYHEY